MPVPEVKFVMLVENLENNFFPSYRPNVFFFLLAVAVKIVTIQLDLINMNI